MSHHLKPPPHHAFHHEAMMTTFSLRICGDDESLMKSLACECFDLIDELERKLSRYYDGGDVSRINTLSAGETLHISEECHECLLVAMEASVHTGGVFDPTLGTMISHQKTGGDGEVPPLLGQLAVHPEDAAVTCHTPGRVIDLGGIGKGFTLDRMADFLKGWEVEGALLSSGASTHLAMGSYEWPIDLAGDEHFLQLPLQDAALSASGTSMQGSHIVHPDEMRGSLHQQPTRIWARSASASFADAWSTALMLMSAEEMQDAPSEAAMLSAIYLETNDGFQCVGE